MRKTHTQHNNGISNRIYKGERILNADKSGEQIPDDNDNNKCFPLIGCHVETPESATNMMYQSLFFCSLI